MDKKYFTYKYGIMVSIVCSLVCLIVCISYIITEAADTNIAFALIPAAIVFLILVPVHGAFPEISDKELCQRNILIACLNRRYLFDDIEKVKVQPLGRHWPAIKIYLRNSKYPRNLGLNGMDKRLIRPFVEELRSKGVTVECVPYKLDGKTIYL